MGTARYGLKPVGPQNPGALLYFDVDPSSTAIYIGDAVELVADKGIAQAAAGNTDNLGVLVAVFDSGGSPALYYPGGNATGYTAVVNTDPHQVYMIHYYHATTALAAADVGLCADWVVGTGNTTTGISGNYITSGSTSAANLRILGLALVEGNTWSTDCEVLVRFCEHIDLPGSAGI